MECASETSGVADAPLRLRTLPPVWERMPSAVWAMPLWFAAAVLLAHGPVAFCLVETLSGIPCPGCGVTRSLLALSRGDFRLSLAMNAAGPFVALFYITQVVIAVAVWTGTVTRHRAALLERSTDLFLAAALGAQWVFRVMIMMSGR